MTDPKPVDVPEASVPQVVTPEEAAKVKGGSIVSTMTELSHIINQQNATTNGIISNLKG